MIVGVSGQKPNVAGGGEMRPYVQSGDVMVGDQLRAPGSLSNKAIEKWDILVRDLAEMGVFKNSDRLLLTELCECLAQAERFRSRLILTPSADLATQEAKILRTGYKDMLQMAMSIAGEFGISPTARVRLGLMKATGAGLLSRLSSPE